MFEGDFEDMCGANFPIMLMGGASEGSSVRRPGSNNPNWRERKFQKLLPFHKSSAWSEGSTELSADVTEDEPVDDPNSPDHSPLQPCRKLYVCTPGRLERY